MKTMIRQELITARFNRGYRSSGQQSDENAQIMARGSKNVLMTGDFKPNGFKGMQLLSFKQGSRVMMPVGESYGGLGNFAQNGVRGSITRVLAALFFSGAGEVFFDGSSLSATASSILQLKVLSNGVWSATYQAGLTRPSAPTLAIRDTIGGGFAGKLQNGTYSAKNYKIRSATGAHSVASETSNIIVAAETNGIGQTGRFTFSAIGSNGADAWGVCVSPRQFGSTGPHFLLREILESELTTIDGVPRSIELEWTDGDLVGQPLAPTESFAPLACVFSGSLQDIFFVDGTYGDVSLGVSAANAGTTIACSLQARPEEFPADWLLFPPEPPTALLRGNDGFYYRFGENSLGIITYVGGDNPIAFQLMWATTGISYPHNACVAEGGRLYAKTGSQGLVRIGAGGRIETDWANPFINDVENWLDIDTVLQWDENSQTVCIMNGFTILPFNSSLGVCGAPIDLTGKISGKIVAATSNRGNLYISCEDAAGSVLKLYRFNAGNGSVIEQRTDWFFARGETDLIRQIDIKGRFDTFNQIEMSLFVNENDAAPYLTKTIAPQKTGLSRLRPIVLSVPNLQSYAVHLKQTSGGADCGFEEVSIKGVPRGLIK